MNQHPFAHWVHHSGYSVRELSQMLKVTRQAVYLWMRGDATPSMQHLIKLGRISHGGVQPWMWAKDEQDEQKEQQ